MIELLIYTALLLIVAPAAIYGLGLLATRTLGRPAVRRDTRGPAATANGAGEPARASQPPT